MDAQMKVSRAITRLVVKHPFFGSLALSLRVEADTDVSTMCIGQAASMGALLLAAGAKGKRYALPHSRILIHQPMGGVSGQASDIEIHAREILKTREDINEILAHHTGKPRPAAGAPAQEELRDGLDELAALFEDDDARQVLHVTFGRVLTENITPMTTIAEAQHAV